MRRRGRKLLGRDRELDVVELFVSQGHVSYRLAHGHADVIALGGELDHPLLVQVKATAGGPFERFTPRERRELSNEATRAHAEAALCWWPTRRSEPVFYAEHEWPAPRPKALA